MLCTSVFSHADEALSFAVKAVFDRSRKEGLSGDVDAMLGFGDEELEFIKVPEAIEQGYKIRMAILLAACVQC